MKGFIFRLLVPVLIIIAGVLALKNGVIVANQTDLNSKPLGILVFHIISLFSFGAKDFGQPIAGPIFWQQVLYSIYFIAPIIFLIAIAEVLLILSKPFMLLLLRRGKHFVVLGYGRIGKAAVEEIQKKYGKASRIVVVDNKVKDTMGGLSLLSWLFQPFGKKTRILFINADLYHFAFESLVLNKCKGIFILTDMEWLNLKIYYAIMNDKKFKKNLYERVLIFTRLSSIDIINKLRENQASGNKEKNTKSTHLFFNIHTAACHQIFDSDLINAGDITEKYEVFQKWLTNEDKINSIIFFGFGRFGATFLNEIKHVKNELQINKIIIIDKKANEAYLNFEQDYLECKVKMELDGVEIICKDAELNELTKIKEIVATSAIDHSIALFSLNDETINVTLATSFHKLYDKSSQLKYIIRTKNIDSFNDELLHVLLGQRFFTIPTYDWVGAYFEDEFAEENKYITQN